MNCNYCGNQRSLKAQAQGLVEDDVQALLDFEKSERFDARQKAALRLAEAMTWGLTMGQQRWNRLLNLGHGSFMGGTTGGLSPTEAAAQKTA